MPRRKSSAGITIGFFGTGEMDIDAAMTLIDEHLKAHPDDPLHFVFVVTGDEFSDTMTELVRVAVNSDIPYEAITSPNDKSRRSFSDALSAASKTHSVEAPLDFLQKLLSEAPGGRLFMLWDREREDEMQEIATAFIEAKVPTFDLTDALTEVGYPEDEAEEEEEAEEAGSAGVIYAKSDMEKMTREELREIATGLGIAPRRSSAAMIEDILEAQEEPAEEEPEEPEPAEEPVEEPVAGEAIAEEFWERMDKAFDRFTSTLLSGLEDMLAKIPAPVQTPQVEPEPEQPRRRLSRSRN